MFNTPLNAIVTVAVALALLVVMPLALRLIDAPGVPVLARWWIPLGVPALVAMALPRGPLATALASVYLLATLALAATCVGRFLRDRRIDAVEVAAFTALVTPSIAASALVAERAGYQLFGFGLGILRLTVPHMHFAGCVAALIAGLAGRAATDRRATDRRAARHKAGTAAALAVPLGTGVVLVGYFIGDAVELLGALILTAGMWLTAWLTLAATTPAATARTAAMSTGTGTAAGSPSPAATEPTTPPAPASAAASGGNGNAGGGGTTRALLRASAATLSVTMVLAVIWAAGEATGLPHPSLTWMAATHGLANAVGFALCAVLAWRRLAVSPL